jgi:Mg2+/Co2+ transporter CorC
VVEFGDTLVREVMTPRTKIVACDEKTTLSELRDLMVNRRHSRIPVYRGDIDHIVGVAYIRRLMAQYIKGKDDDPITGIIRPVLSIPETKPVAKLLEELQERGDYTAIVIDEFGGVAGLVTIEDLVEEIVGEIWDEDDTRVRQVVKEEEGVFVLRGSAEISSVEGLEEIMTDDMNCSTVAGLVLAQVLEPDPAVGADPAVADVAVIEQLDQARPGDAEEVRGLLDRELDGVGDDLDPLAVRQVPQDLREQHRRLARYREDVASGEFALDSDGTGPGMGGQVLADPSRREPREFRVAIDPRGQSLRGTGHVRHLAGARARSDRKHSPSS